MIQKYCQSWITFLKVKTNCKKKITERPIVISFLPAPGQALNTHRLVLSERYRPLMVVKHQYTYSYKF